MEHIIKKVSRVKTVEHIDSDGTVVGTIRESRYEYYCTVCNVYLGYKEAPWHGERKWCDGCFSAGQHFNKKHLALDKTITACLDGTITGRDDDYRFGYECNKCKTLLKDVDDVIFHKKLCSKFNIESDKMTCLDCGHNINTPFGKTYMSWCSDRNKDMTYDYVLQHLYEHDCSKICTEKYQMFMLLCARVDTDSAKIIVQKAFPKVEFNEWKKKFVEK